MLRKIIGGLVLFMCIGSMVLASLFGPEGITSREWRVEHGEPPGVDDWVRYERDGGRTVATATVLDATPGFGKYPKGTYADDTDQYRLELRFGGDYDSFFPGKNPDGGGWGEQGSYELSGSTLTLSPNDSSPRSYQVETLTIEYGPAPSADAGTRAQVDGLRLRDGAFELVLHRSR